MTYNDLKASPLGKKDIEPEEVAIWLDMNDLCNASGMMKLLRLIENNYQIGTIDYFDLDENSMPKHLFKIWKDIDAGYASSRILKNIFMALFKCKAIREKKDVKSLLNFANTKVKNIKKKYKLMHGYNAYDISCPRSIENLLEVYAELAERLQNALEDMQDDAG